MEIPLLDYIVATVTSKAIVVPSVVTLRTEVIVGL
jgi:hypothetical protein